MRQRQRMRTRVVALLAGTALLAVPAACGGDDDAASDAPAETTTAATSPSTTTGPSAALVGTWFEEHGPFVVRFAPDGKFSIDNDGSLEDGSHEWGTYTVEGSKVHFVAHEGSPCRGHEWDFEISLSDPDKLDAELLNDACATTAGTRWSLEKRPDS